MFGVDIGPRAGGGGGQSASAVSRGILVVRCLLVGACFDKARAMRGEASARARRWQGAPATRVCATSHLDERVEARGPREKRRGSRPTGLHRKTQQ